MPEISVTRAPVQTELRGNQASTRSNHYTAYLAAFAFGLLIAGIFIYRLTRTAASQTPLDSFEQLKNAVRQRDPEATYYTLCDWLRLTRQTSLVHWKQSLPSEVSDELGKLSANLFDGSSAPVDYAKIEAAISKENTPGKPSTDIPALNPG